jgi:hypothetical protein
MKNLNSKIVVLGMLILLISSTLIAKDNSETSPIKMNVRVFNYAGLSGSELNPMGKEIERIFRLTGIEASWTDCGTRETPNPACSEALGSTDFILRILGGGAVKASGLAGSTLGVSNTPVQGGVFASIYYGKVEELAKQHLASHPQILAHASAHELGHLLLGQLPHTPQGIMRAQWGRTDLQDMSMRRLNFNSTQANLMKADLQKRMVEEGENQPSSIAQK